MADCLPRRTRLIHLHGSLTWLRNPQTGKVYRFRIEELRAINYWHAWRDGGTKWERGGLTNRCRFGSAGRVHGLAIHRQ